VTLWPVVTHGLLSGVILSAILFPMILLLVRINPEIMLRDYPPDIQAKYGPMRDRSRRQRLPVALLFLAVMFGVIAASLAPVLNGIDPPRLFTTAFVHLFAMFFGFNMLDWLVLDWLIVVTLRPRFLILPGTEGMAGYADYAFHFRGFLIGIPIAFVASLVLSGLVTILF
jgi:hypothetical protein